MLNGIKGGQVIRYEVALNFSLFAPRTLISSSRSFLESEHDVVWVAVSTELIRLKRESVIIFLSVFLFVEMNF